MAVNLMVFKTKNGHYAAFEQGGSFGNEFGHAIIIAGRRGEKLKPIFVKLRPIPCKQHALFKLKDGYWAIEVIRHNDQYNINLYLFKSKYGTFFKAYSFFNNVWNDDPPPYLIDAINACKEKTKCIKCKESHYSLKMDFQNVENPETKKIEDLSIFI